MNLIRTVIIDDEPVARQGIERYVSEVNFLELAGSYSAPAKAPAGLIENKTDLLLLDIKMQHVNGLDYYRSLGDNAPLVIIISAFPEYALDGFELAVTDYLVKPVPFDRFRIAVQRAREIIDLKRSPRAEYDTTGESFFIKTKGKIQRINTSEILYIEGLSNYVIIHTATAKCITYLGLGWLEEKLKDYRFVRSHKSYLVALDKVESIGISEITISSHVLPLSRSYKEQVMKMVDPHLLKR